MKSIENDIRDYIINNKEMLTFSNISINEPFSYKKPDLTKVNIIIQEISNSPSENTFTNEEEHSNLSYQITILNRTQIKVVDDKKEVVSPYQVSKTTYEELVDLLYNQFLLTRIGDPYVRSYNKDDTVLERVFRVENTIDLEHEYLYRR